MQPMAIACFTLTLFLAFAVRIQGNRRRDVTAARLNRGLLGYVAALETHVIPV
jgi:hypothetical protein